MNVKPYTTEYQSQCLAIFDSNVGVYFDPSERIDFVAYLEDANAVQHYFVFEQQGTVVACGGYFANQNTGSLAWGMVHRLYHRRGFGAEITDFRMAQIKRISSIDRIKIETSQLTQGFYAKRGFEVTDIVENGYGQGIDCVSMTFHCGDYQTSE